MAGTGTPRAYFYSQAPNGAVDNRVILVSPKVRLSGSMASSDITGSRPIC